MFQGIKIFKYFPKTSRNTSVFSIPNTFSTFNIKSANFATQNVKNEPTNEVEVNLFENSQLYDEPVNAKQYLRQYEKPNNPKRKVYKKPQKKIPIESGSPEQQKTKPTRVKSIEIFNEDLNASFTKLHLNDPWLQTLLLSVKSKKYRSENHQLFVEGRRLIIDAIKCGLPMKYLLFSKIEFALQLKDHISPLKNVQLVKVPHSDLTFWSTLTTCPGLIGIFEKPHDMDSIWKTKSTFPITVICDQIREPNNVGSIIRNCASVPCSQVILTKGCTDPWETKALRGGAGSQFLIPVRGPMDWSSIPSFLPEKYSAFVAENREENIQGKVADSKLYSYTTMSIDQQLHNVLIIGGETHGVSDEAYNLLKQCPVGKCIHIPLAEGVDSLNTASALAVILFEMKKRCEGK